MSNWVYIKGVINVAPMGRTQHEKTYILKTILDHLPVVSGSEGEMEIFVNESKCLSSCCSCDEHGEHTNNLVDRYGCKSKEGWLRYTDAYFVTVDGNLRDRYFEEVFHDFQKWLCRLAKRVCVDDVLVRIDGFDSKDLKYKKYIINDSSVYNKMFEPPSWSFRNKDHEPTWCEYLMWDPAKYSMMPLMLTYKYVANDENDAEAEHRIRYHIK